MGSPLWQRGVRGDFIEIFDSIGVTHYKLCAKNDVLHEFTQFNVNLLKIIKSFLWEGNIFLFFPNRFPHYS